MVDAFVAGLPVIASDWHLNKEIIIEGETGFLIKPCEEEDLLKIMEKCILNPSILNSMRDSCQRKAMEYDVDVVVTKDLFKSIGLI